MRKTLLLGALLIGMISGVSAQSSVATFETDTSSEWGQGTFTFTSENSGNLRLTDRDLELTHFENGGGLLHRDIDDNTGDFQVNGDPGGVFDYQDDGDPDVAFIDASDDTVKFVDASGNVHSTGFSTSESKLGGAGDYDNDGLVEIVIPGGTVVDENGNTESVTGQRVGGMGDIDGDNDPEIAVEDRNTIKYIDNGGSTVSTGASGFDIGGVADFDQDGDGEIAFKDTNFNADYVDSSGTVSSFGTGVGGRMGVTAADIDGDQLPEASFGGTSLVDKNGETQSLSGRSTIGGSADFDNNGDTKDFGFYDSKQFSASEEKIWENITISNFDKNGNQFNITIETSNNGFSSVLESETISNNQISSSGTQTIDLSFSQGATDVRYTVGMSGTTTKGPSTDSIEIDGKTANKPPTIDSTTFNPSTFQVGDNPDVTVDASDDNEITEIKAVAKKDGNQIASSTKSFSSASVSTTFTDLFNVGSAGTYDVTVTATDNQAETGQDSKSDTVKNNAPTVSISGTSGTVDAGTQNYDFTVTSSNDDYPSEPVSYTVTVDGSEILSGSDSGDFSVSDSFSENQRGSHTLKVEVTDGGGNTDSDSNTFTLQDLDPSVKLESPTGEQLSYSNSFQVSTSGDSDSYSNEDLQCSLEIDGSQFDQRTITEGDSYTVSETADLGGHSGSLNCTETNNGNFDTGSTSFTVKAFEFTGKSANSPVFEFTNQTFSATVKAGEMVEEADYNLVWNSSTVSTFTETFSGSTTRTESTEFTIPLVQSDGSSFDYYLESSVNISDISSGYETLSRNTSTGSQTVNFEVENPQITVSDSDIVEDRPVDVEVTFTDNVQGDTATVTGSTTYNGDTETGLSNTFDAPLVSGTANTSVSASGDLTISFEGDTRTQNTGTTSQTVYRKILTNCVDPELGVTGVKSQELLLRNEQNQTESISGDIDYNYDITAQGSDHSRNYAFSVANKTKAETCIYPDFAEYNATGPIVYSSPNYAQRQFPLTEPDTLTSSVRQIKLFLLKDSVATDTVISLEDASSSPIDGTVKVLRYFPGNNTFTTVAKAPTGSDGETKTVLKEEAFYRFIAQKNGEIILDEDAEQFFASQIPAVVELTVGQNLPEYLEADDGFSFQTNTLTNSNGTVNGLEATVNHETSSIQNAQLNVSKGLGIGSKQICSKSTQSTAQTLFCDFNETVEGNSFTFTLSAKKNNEQHILETGSFDGTKGLFGVNQAFAGLLVFLSIGAFGFVTPRMAIVFSTGGAVVAYALGLISVGIGAMASLVLVGAIVLLSGQRRGSR